MATVIIGAGAGGLAAAIALAAKGEAVTVLEKQSGPGGKLLPVTIDGQDLDSGPTVLTMKWVFDELFALAGTEVADVLTLKRLSLLARHYWTGGATLDLHADHETTVDAIGRFTGASGARDYRAFAKASHEVHQALLQPFLKSQRPTLWSLPASMPLGDLMRINPFETLWSALGSYFSDPRLRQLFGRYATYCGSSPFRAPGTLMLIADVEAQGVWRLNGGMAALALALQSSAASLGVTFHFNRAAARIETVNGRVSAVIDGKGERHPCNAVIVNADSAAVAEALLGGSIAGAVEAPDAAERSLSAITWCGFTEDSGVPLSHHTVFFSDDYRAEFAELAAGPASDPTVYVCDQDGGKKLILVNAPADGAAAPDDIDARMLRSLSKCGLTLKLDHRRMLRRSPRDFAALYPATHGALYGRASHGWMSTFRRPQARTPVPGLYLAGGSVHPGPGVPMAALSGMRAAEALLEDRTSMRR